MNIIQLLAERKIQEAIDNGDLENLSGSGQPIDLTEDLFTPESLRMMYRILKNASYIPPEVELMREVAELREKLRDLVAAEPDSEKIPELLKLISEKETLMNAKIEGYRRMFGGSGK